MKILIYGPPGSGKTTAGQYLAQQLDLPFYDLDQEIEARTNLSISGIFKQFGEAGFRQIESEELHQLLFMDEFVLALGGGALLSDQNRAAASNAGPVVCLFGEPGVLVQRLSQQADSRPLVMEDLNGRLERLLQEREEHYASFPLQVETTHLSPVETAWQMMTQIGRFRLNSMGPGTDVYVQSGHLSNLGALLKEDGLQGRVLVVSDDHVAPPYSGQVLQSLAVSGFDATSFVFPSGESFKNLDTISLLWEAMLAAGLDRKSTLLALGGGVVTDLAGFAAATYLRGIRWVAVPTTLLGMVDASLGGKTGIDLLQGKNLVGAFYPPRLVLADPDVLNSLPAAERRSGLAEVVKHAVIASPALFEELSGRTLESGNWETLVRQAMAIKLRVIEEDPFESGKRVILNLGHTVGHAIERASDYKIRHGEAVAIGLVFEARIGEALGVTRCGTAETIRRVLSNYDLPVSVPPELDRSQLRLALGVDKKRNLGKITLPLPVTVGQARDDIEIEEQQLWSLFLSCMAQT